MSYTSLFALVFLGLWFLGLAPAYGQEKKPSRKPWTGRQYDGRVITKGDMDKILQKHQLWLESDGKKGESAFLSSANLVGVPLGGLKIGMANLSKAFLEEANLSKAYLSYCNLSEAHLQESNLSEAYLDEADLSKADLRGANLRGADLMGADLSEANLDSVKMNGADLMGANLRGVIIVGTNFSEANLSGANLRGARFEPKPGTLPGVSLLIGIKGLDSLTYDGTASYSLVELREIFRKAGMRDEERQLTYALNHTRRVNAWKENTEQDYGVVRIPYVLKEKEEGKKIDWISRERGRVENNFQLVFFEWTCDYGMTPSRPLLLMFAGLFVFTLPYLVALRSKDPETGIWVILPRDRVLDRKLKDHPLKLTFNLPCPPLPEKRYRFRGRLWRGWRGLRLAFYFPMLSAFHLGWRELNVGAWITRLQKREYNLRATGWPRMVSGFQSLLSVYLLALWALTYFGRPFE